MLTEYAKYREGSRGEREANRLGRQERLCTEHQERSRDWVDEESARGREEGHPAEEVVKATCHEGKPGVAKGPD